VRKRSEQRKERGGRREREAPTGGAPVSAAAGKKKKGGRKAGEGKGKWAGGLQGRKGKDVFLFFKLFSNQFFSIEIQTKPFKLFHRIL
jgi:hypothetical protein